MFSFTSGYQTFLHSDVFPRPPTPAGARGRTLGRCAVVAVRRVPGGGSWNAARGPVVRPAAERLVPSSEFLCPARQSLSVCVLQVLFSQTVTGLFVSLFIYFLTNRS